MPREPWMADTAMVARVVEDVADLVQAALVGGNPSLARGLIDEAERRGFFACLADDVDELVDAAASGRRLDS